jgi:hypothetical protein
MEKSHSLTRSTILGADQVGEVDLYPGKGADKL